MICTATKNSRLQATFTLFGGLLAPAWAEFLYQKNFEDLLPITQKTEVHLYIISITF